MFQQHVVRGILCGLLVMAGFAPALAQLDPMLGGYGVGKSEEIVSISAQYAESTGVYIGLYDWTGSALAPLDSQLLVTCEASDWGPKQVDIAVGDFNCDGKDDIVAVAQTTDSAFALIIPRFVPGSPLTWDTPHTWHSSPNALYYSGSSANISGLRLLAADLDTIPGQEFVLAYLTPDAQVRLIMYKTDSLLIPDSVTSVLDADVLWTTHAGGCNERSHVFDITAGDFDGDWVDEILLIGEYRDTNGKYVLYGSIYEYSGDSLQLVHREDSLVWQDGFVGPATEDLVDRIAVAAADFHGTGRDQALLFVHGIKQTFSDCNKINEQFGGLFGLRVSEELDFIDTTGSLWAPADWSGWWVYHNEGKSETSDHGLAVADVDLDGRAEFAFRNGRRMRIANWNPNDSIGWVTDISEILCGKYDYVSESRRPLIFADLDFDTSQTSWTPEVITGWNDPGADGGGSGHLRTWKVDIDGTSHLADGITQIHDIAISDGTGISDWWHPIVLAAGDFDGDGVRLGKPNHVYFKHDAEPMVVLNSPPMHYDLLLNDTIALNDTLDLTGFWTGGPIDSGIIYQASSDTTTSVGSKHTMDWNVSASAGGKFGLWGQKFEYKVTAAYGGESQRISGSTKMIHASTSVHIAGGDVARSQAASYDIWEYPIYNSDSLQGYYVVVRPKEGIKVDWSDPTESVPAQSYRSQHEVGSVLSYPSDTAELIRRGDVDYFMRVGETWNLRGGVFGGTNQSYGIDDLIDEASSLTHAVGVDVEAETELAGTQLKATGGFGIEGVKTRSSTIGSGFQVRTKLSGIQDEFSPYAYDVSPVSYWSKSGALVVDYIVNPHLPGGDSWWTRDYGTKPDPAFLLPWRYYEAKGIALGEPSKRYRTPDLYFAPSQPVRGEVVMLHGRVYNYSLDSLESDVDLRFYSGNPECLEAEPLYSTSGDSTVTLTGGIGARTFQDFEFEWSVPLGASDNARVWVLLDPEDAIDEIHDNNNLCWVGVFVSNPVVQTCTPECPIVMTGDANENGSITSADIIHMVNFVFKGGLAPGPCEAAGDVNCNGTCTSADIISLVNFVFKGGTAPCDACTTDPSGWNCP